MTDFVHLHVHSQSSPYWGLHSPEKLCRAAREMGMTRLALTDRNGLYGIPNFIAAAREAGIAPLVGSELETDRHRAVLLAQNRHGYANLCRIISARHCDPAFDLPAALTTEGGGLAILSDNRELLQSLRKTRRSQLYVELSPGHDLAGSLRLSRKLQLPPVATSRAVLLTGEDLELHQVLRAIAGRTTLDRLDPAASARPGDRLLSAPHLADHFPHCPEALRNASQLAGDLCSDWDFAGMIFPGFAGLADAEAGQLLEQRARQGARRRYNRLDDTVEDRLQMELQLIRSKGFAHYFLVVEEIVAQSQRTCGRGSAAASLVAYCLGITHVDPLRHNLFFERFLNEGRVDPPDIDIDFPWDERDAILDFVFSRYTARRAAMVANQIGFKGRGALREVAKLFGVPTLEIKQVTRRISGYWKADQTARAIEDHPLFRGEQLGGEWPRILDIASRLRGQLRHLGLHCGGVVIVPEEIRRYVPVQTSAKGLPVIQWEKDQTEAAGLVKIDILGNRSLAVIRDALAAVERNTGNAIDYAAWQPLEDSATRKLLCRGASMGCFYIESPATRQLLRRMFGPEKGETIDPDQLFEQLVMASSIIRPAANRYILEFVARLRGKSWTPLHPLLEPVLNETYGIAIYQEQITQMAMALADFSSFEGDQLRKIISKKAPGRRLEEMRERFFRGGRGKGLTTELTEELWAQILSFAGYSFCKPHSASYALVSCKSAWLKANYPAEFMAAVISNQGGFYSPYAYLSESRRLGLRILPPDINCSFWDYRGKGDRIRVGLMQISGVGRPLIENMLRERMSSGPFANFSDYLQRTALPPEATRQLVKAGCFDRLESPLHRPELLWRVIADSGRPASNGLLLNGPSTVPSLPEFSPVTAADQRDEAIDIYLNAHPLARHRERLLQLGAIPARDLERHVGHRVCLGGWWVTGKTVQTRKGEPMQFITFEDESRLFETTFFPQAYNRYCRLLGLRRPYLVEGLVEEEFGVATLTVERLGFLD